MMASDEDRDLAISDLRDACASGRLTTEQYMARMQAALGAPTLQELWFLTSDIPRMSAWPAPATVSTASYPPYPPYQPYPAYPSYPPMWGAPSFYPPVPWTSGVVRPKPNPLAVIAFILSFLGFLTWPLFIGSVVACGLGIIALSQIKRSKTGEGGNGLAIAAVAISASSLVIGLTVFLHGVHHLA